jgi:PDZ domain-containing protein
MIAISMAVVSIPYVSIMPGSARPVAQLITVDGHPTYAPEGALAFTTVSVRGSSPTSRLTLFDALRGWLDNDVDVFNRDILGGRSGAENRRYNQELMATSQAVATAVAARHLGFDVTTRSTGTIVRAISPDTPAAEVLELDDVVVAVDGQPIDRPGRIGELLAVGGVGAEHVLTVERPAGTDQRVEVRAKTTADEDDPDRPILGFTPEERITGFDLPFEVTIATGDVGGPSAGLAFTLALLDVLTPGELTGGRPIAVTGTMNLDGTVGPVGGGRQKAIAVRNAGYEAFLVPSAEFEEVERAVGDDLQVIAVDTLDEALDALASLGGNARSLRPEDAGASS